MLTISGAICMKSLADTEKRIPQSISSCKSRPRYLYLERGTSHRAVAP
jgi:hypothetical protein